MSAPEWETSKENVAPVARGRNVDTLTAALSKTPEDLERERLFHEAAIRDSSNGTGPYAPDPLVPWVTYAKWAVDNFPRGSDVIVAAVEGACRRFAKEQRYLDDRRFVRLWVRYADMRKDKLDVFAYMQRRRIGEHVALFYEAWATTLELARQFDKAEATYALGRRFSAEPAARLAQREREFFSRMDARRRRAEKKAKVAEEKHKAAEKLKESSKLSRGRPTLADDILAQPDRGDVYNDEGAVDSENVAPGASSRREQLARPALGRISERQAQTGHRPVAPVDRKKAGISRERQSEASVVQGNELKRKPDKIDVYVDPAYAASSPMAKHRETMRQEGMFPLPLLAKKDDLHKENDGRLPSKWAGETLPQNDKSRKTLLRSAPSARQQFEIYHDEDRHEQQSEPPTGTEPRAHNFLEQVPQKRPQSPAPARKGSSNVGPVSPTINTKIAMQEIDDMFNSSLPMERARDEALAESFSAQRRAVREQNSRKPASIQIYRDVDGDNGHEKENALGTAPRRSGGAEGPSGNPSLEKRVLKPVHELEGPYVERAAEDPVEDNEALIRSEDQNKEQNIPPQPTDDAEASLNDVFEFLAEWRSQEPTCYLLDGADSEVEKDTPGVEGKGEF